MKHRIILSLVLFSGFLASAAVKPNVLLICVDDLKPVLGCYGDARAKTPNLDQLATRSLRLDRAYCNQAVCSPSRNALMTGLRPQTLGIYDLGTNFRKSRPEAVTLAQHFKANGYHAAAMGKIFHVGHGNVDDTASWSVPHFYPAAAQHFHKENLAPTGPEAETKMLRGTSTENADVPDDAYARKNWLGRAIRTDRNRLVEWKRNGADPSSAEFELYDYQTDPAETKNLAKEFPAIVTELQKLLATHPAVEPQWSQKQAPKKESKAGKTTGGLYDVCKP